MSRAGQSADDSVVAFYTHAAKERTSEIFALVLILAVLGTVALDAYALATLSL